MRKFQSILLVASITAAISIITGCGVSQEESSLTIANESEEIEFFEIDVVYSVKMPDKTSNYVKAGSDCSAYSNSKRESFIFREDLFQNHAYLRCDLSTSKYVAGAFPRVTREFGSLEDGKYFDMAISILRELFPDKNTCYVIVLNTVSKNGDLIEQYLKLHKFRAKWGSDELFYNFKNMLIGKYDASGRYIRDAGTGIDDPPP